MNFPKIDSPLAQSYVSDVVNSITDKMDSGEVTSLEALRVEIYSSLLQTFESLSDFAVDVVGYDKEDFKDPEVWNSNIRALDVGLKTLFSEAISLNNNLVSQHNLITEASRKVEDKSNKLNESLNELRNTIEKRQFYTKGKSVTVFEDSFIDTDNVNFSKTSGVVVDTSISSVTLQPASNVNRRDKVRAVSLISNHDSPLDRTPYEEDGLPTKPAKYEGKRFGLVGTARPQLNVWNIDAKNTRLDKSNPDIEIAKPDDNIQNYYSNLHENRYGDSFVDDSKYYPNPDYVIETQTVTTYEIFKDGVSHVKNSPGIVQTSDGSLQSWTTSEGQTVVISSEDTAVYTFTSNSTTQDVKVDMTSEEIESKIAEAKAADPTYVATKDVNPDDILQETSSGYEAKDLGELRITPEEYLFDDYAVDPDNIIYLEEGSDAFSNTFTREDFVYAEIKPSESELEAGRFAMFDEDPNTFWEIEYTPVVTSLDPSSIHNTLLNVSGSTLASVGETDAAAYAQYQGLTTTYLESNSPDDLTITLTIELDSVYLLNYIDLSPVFFENADVANIEIVDLVTKESETSPEVDVKGYNPDADSTIGSNSNSSLTDLQMDNASVSNRFGFKARGFWSFPLRKVKYIKIKIKQDTAVINPYQVKILQLLKKSQYTISQSRSYNKRTTDTFTTTNDAKSGSGSILERGRVTSTIQFSYLETLLDFIGSADTSLLAGVTGQSNIGSESSSGAESGKDRTTNGVFTQAAGMVATALITNSAAYNISAGGALAIGGALLVAGSIIDAKLSGGSSTSSSSSTSKNFGDSGFQINKEYYKTLYARPRYAIGIRDLGIYSKTYEQVGEMSSKVYKSVAGKRKLTLEVQHNVPSTFTKFAPGHAFISYFISINGQVTEIAPIRMPPPSLPYESLPTSIDLSTYGSDQDLIDIEFMAKINRPLESSLRNAESETPILSRYKIVIEST